MRAFVAVELPPEVREAVARGLAELRQRIPAARWVRPEGVHVIVERLSHVRLHVRCGALRPVRSCVPVVILHWRPVRADRQRRWAQARELARSVDDLSADNGQHRFEGLDLLVRD